MNDGFEDRPDAPRRALQPIRVELLRALRRIGGRLSASQLSDALGGNLSEGQAGRHLSALEAFGLLEEPAGESGTNEEQLGEAGIDTPYRLHDEEVGEDE